MLAAGLDVQVEIDRDARAAGPFRVSRMGDRNRRSRAADRDSGPCAAARRLDDEWAGLVAVIVDPHLFDLGAAVNGRQSSL
jgi:hypothetical protein